MLLLIDNFDSFTYNLVQAFEKLGEPVKVVRNHALTVEECLGLRPDYLVIGPGPGNPSGAGISKKLIQAAKGIYPILGICLGHQAIGEVYGGKIVRASHPMHGKVDSIFHQNQGIFEGLPEQFLVTRYHSLLVDRATLSEMIQITATTSSGEIMGLRHRLFPLEGVQFHPESIATQFGESLLQNFLRNYSRDH